MYAGIEKPGLKAGKLIPVSYGILTEMTAQEIAVERANFFLVSMAAMLFVEWL